MSSVRIRGARLVVALTAFLVYAAVAGLNAGQASAGTWEDLAWMYQPSEIVDVHLTLTEDQKALLDSDDPLRDWVGDVGFWMTGSGGRAFGSSDTPWRIEAKLKGHSTFRFLDGKAAFNLKFPSATRPDGLKRMTLNNMVKDPTYMRETLSYDVFRASGIPAPRTGHARLWINDEYYGLYLNLEKWNDQSLEHWFPNTQHLYEAARTQDILRSGDDLKTDFEVDEGDEEDWSDLESLSAAVRTGEWAVIQSHLADPEGAIKYLAAEWYLGHWDGYSWSRRNYYLHSDASGLFSFLPWGTDLTLRPPFRDNYDLFFPLTAATDGWNRPDGAAAVVDACFADPACSDEFIHQLQVVRQAAAGLDLEAAVADLTAELTPLIVTDPRKEVTMQFVQKWQAKTIPYLDAQASRAEELLRTHPLTMHSPAITAAPQAVTTATDATFEFGAGLDETQGVTGFQCRLDGGAFSSCAPPVAYSGLTAGEHSFEVRAVNDGNTPSPVTPHAWTINPPQNTLSVIKVGDGSGTVSADPEGPDYEVGTEVTLTATADAGSVFEGWSGCDSVNIDGDCVVVTTGEVKIVTAAFALIAPPPKYTLTINEIGDGSGTVSAEPEGPEYDAGTGVTLTATPAAGSTFAGWSGCDSVTIGGECAITMDAAETVTAEFSLPKAVITATIPASPANNNNPKIKGTLPSGGTLDTVKIYANGSCSGKAAAKRAPAKFTGAGIPITVPDNSTTTITATVNLNGSATPCSDPFTYVEDSTAP